MNKSCVSRSSHTYKQTNMNTFTCENHRCFVGAPLNAWLCIYNIPIYHIIFMCVCVLVYDPLQSVHSEKNAFLIYLNCIFCTLGINNVTAHDFVYIFFPSHCYFVNFLPPLFNSFFSSSSSSTLRSSFRSTHILPVTVNLMKRSAKNPFAMTNLFDS